ncbi:MAG: hypothetical protein WBZ51_08220 [Xanthobacteraceae bacterium]
MSDKPTLLFDVLDALEDALKHCAPDKRQALANALDAYSEDCAEDFWWALGQQSPTMLHMLMTTIYSGCQTGSGATRNVVVRLRKPEGNA